MRVERLEIHNFRGFGDTFIDFPQSNIAVFIGTNGQGKSSILDLLAMSFEYFVIKLTHTTENQDDEAKQKINSLISFNDINNNHVETINTVLIKDCTLYNEDIEKINPIHIENGTIPKDLILGISQILGRDEHEKARTRTSRFTNLYGFIQQHDYYLTSFGVNAGIEYNKKQNIPLLVYYQSNRTVYGQVNLNKKLSLNPISQLNAYENAFSKKENNFDDFFSWFRAEEDKENELIRRKKNFDARNPLLEVVRKALTVFFNNLSDHTYTNLRVEREDSSLNNRVNFRQDTPSASLIITKNQTDMRLEQLSDGEKNLILMVSDIARRLAIANPSLSNPLTGEGIVLIDEIELHLHPKWQRAVLSALSVTFPILQFIATTHSPLVLSHLPEESAIFSIIKKRDGESLILKHQKEDFNPYGSEPSRILRLIMDTDERPQDIEELLLKYGTAIDENKLQEAEKWQTLLKQKIDPNDPQILRGQATIEAKKILQTL